MEVACQNICSKASGVHAVNLSGSLQQTPQVQRLRAATNARLRPLSGRHPRSVVVHAYNNTSDGGGKAVNGGSGGFRGGLDPSLEMVVPSDQRPVNELSALRQATLYSWATLPLSDYVQRLVITWGGFFTVIGGPIAYQTFDPWSQPGEFALSAGVGSLLVVAVAVLRIYLGWSYVGNRLLSAAVEYEETGWYDGQLFVKPPEVLARDRLLGSYEVKPVLRRLKTTLTASGGALLLSTILLFGLIRSGTDADGQYGRGAAVPVRRDANGEIIYSAGLRNLADLRDDDKAAAEEAAAQGGRPGYCGDRQLRAAAGGQYCAKFDLQRRR